MFRFSIVKQWDLREPLFDPVSRGDRLYLWCGGPAAEGIKGTEDGGDLERWQMVCQTREVKGEEEEQKSETSDISTGRYRNTDERQ